jgi:hypothetical protein
MLEQHSVVSDTIAEHILLTTIAWFYLPLTCHLFDPQPTFLYEDNKSAIMFADHPGDR